jgi:HEAT repeat protein
MRPRRVELYGVALNTLLRSWNLARSLAPRPLGEESRIEQTRAVWSHIAFWMQAEANRDVGRDKLHRKLVQVLTEDFDKSEYDALAIAESYLASAAETSGLVEARGPNTFGFVHQSFQEYLAALYLARPASKALKKISGFCHDPRWTEVIRLAVGHLSIALGERETVGKIVHRLLAAADPLEPFLCSCLRLALGCLADQVDLRQAQVDAVLVAAAQGIIQTPYKETRDSLVAALEAVESAPGTKAQAKLLELISAEGSHTRMEGVRLIGLSPCLGPDILGRLQAVLERDQDDGVRAHAALALWRHGRRTRETTLAIADGLLSPNARLRNLPDDAFRSALVKLLEDPDTDVRRRAAMALFNGGQEETALRALVKLLGDPDAQLRSMVVWMLSDWGQKETALPTLVKLLAEPDAWVRYRAADSLGEWGRQQTALPALLKLLADPQAWMRYQAAVMLGKWGQKEIALPTLVNLLSDPDVNERSRAAEVLAKWGPQETVLPTLVKLLADPVAYVRCGAAKVLGKWGQSAQW